MGAFFRNDDGRRLDRLLRTLQLRASSPRTSACAKHSASAGTGVGRASTTCGTPSLSARSWTGIEKGSIQIAR